MANLLGENLHDRLVQTIDHNYYICVSGEGLNEISDISSPENTTIIGRNIRSGREKRIDGFISRVIPPEREADVIQMKAALIGIDWGRENVGARIFESDQKEVLDLMIESIIKASEEEHPDRTYHVIYAPEDTKKKLIAKRMKK